MSDFLCKMLASSVIIPIILARNTDAVKPVSTVKNSKKKIVVIKENLRFVLLRIVVNATIMYVM